MLSAMFEVRIFIPLIEKQQDSKKSDICQILDHKGFKASAHTGDVADYVIERAFVEK